MFSLAGAIQVNVQVFGRWSRLEDSRVDRGRKPRTGRIGLFSLIRGCAEFRWRRRVFPASMKTSAVRRESSSWDPGFLADRADQGRSTRPSVPADLISQGRSKTAMPAKQPQPARPQMTRTARFPGGSNDAIKPNTQPAANTR